ncbi:MAG: TIGR03790 family protein [Planctomycetota bacterium]
MLILVCCGAGFALQPDEILVIANRDVAASVKIAQYYCAKRNVPVDNLLALPLGTSLSYTITRDDYEKKLAGPIRKKLSRLESADQIGPQTQKRAFGKPIRCLLMTYGVPIKVGRRRPLKGQEDKLRQLQNLAEEERSKIEQLGQSGEANTSGETKNIKRKLARLQSEIDRIVGKETNACVDSELSIVLFDDYELYLWQPNKLKDNLLGLRFNTLMVSRLDGPGFEIAKGLIDKAIAAEETGLRGFAYIDSRGIAKDKKPYSFGYFDQSLRDLEVFTRFRTELTVKQERTEELFAPGACPQTAIYCGWYSLKKYVDAFDFVDGAIGYHISSLEAVDIRDPNSSQWCPAMLNDGITVTLGAVAEPYLHSFPEPRVFFLELFNGHCLVEAYYHTKPFNSWQLVLIGDPLYRPFKKP